MGCVMSRKVSKTTSTGSQTSNSPRCGTNRYSNSSSCSTASAHYRPRGTESTMPNSSPAMSQGSTQLIKPERTYSPVDRPPNGCPRRDKPIDANPCSVIGGINSLFRSKKVLTPFSDIPLTDTTTPLSQQRAERKPKLFPFSCAAKPKNLEKNTSSAPTESKLEISWPTDCYRNPGLLPSAIAMGYPYPYPFPLSAVPSDPDLVATAEAVAYEADKDAQKETQKEDEGVYCGYYGYEYECLLEAGKEGASGGVRLEIRPGRNPKWEPQNKVAGAEESPVESS